jgi:hypothetical protein
MIAMVIEMSLREFPTIEHARGPVLAIALLNFDEGRLEANQDSAVAHAFSL